MKVKELNSVFKLQPLLEVRKTRVHIWEDFLYLYLCEDILAFVGPTEQTQRLHV